MVGFFGLFNFFDDGLDDVVQFVGDVVEFMFVAAHGFLEAAWSGGFVYFYDFFIFVNLEEGTDVVLFGQH